MSMDLHGIVCELEPVVREAGLAALSLQANLGEIRYKTPKDVVTAADLESERLLVGEIRKRFPEHAVRTEEAGKVSAGSLGAPCWFVDPVDGTVNFSRGLPMWGVSAALVENGEPLAAICFLPRLGEMFVATKGGGAFMNGVKISVSETSELSHAIVTNGDFNVGEVAKINPQNLRNFAREAEACMRVKCMGSAVAEGCCLAAGRLDGFVMTMSYPWDIAGVALIVREAGGSATEISGAALEFRDREDALFSNGVLHRELVKVLNG